MNLIHVREIQVCQAVTQLSEVLTTMCDLPIAVSHAYAQIDQLKCTLQSVVPDPLAQAVCDHLSAHVQLYVQYVTHPDPYTLISWSHMTRLFLDAHAFNRTFCDLWKAHVHLCMLHAQANWAHAWDQEQACWFKHNDVCDMLRVQFEVWLKDRIFEHDVTLH